MKSAYELAMERLEAQNGPSKKLTDAQKAEIAEIDTRFDAKIAELKLDREPNIPAAAPDEQGTLRVALAEEIAALETDRRKAKDAVWDAG